jgi:hypothetical protein
MGEHAELVLGRGKSGIGVLTVPVLGLGGSALLLQQIAQGEVAVSGAGPRSLAVSAFGFGVVALLLESHTGEDERGRSVGGSYLRTRIECVDRLEQPGQRWRFLYSFRFRSPQPACRVGQFPTAEADPCELVHGFEMTEAGGLAIPVFGVGCLAILLQG